MLTSDLIFSGDVMWQQTPAAERVYARKRVRSEFIERRRVWERVAARRGRGGFIPEIFLRARSGGSRRGSGRIIFPFHDARYACLRARENERNGERRTMAAENDGNRAYGKRIRTLRTFRSNFSESPYDR